MWQGAAAAPACYQDVQCALRYLHANAASLNIDPNKIYVIGQSAGGHLAALCATLGDGVLEKTGGWESASSKVAAAIAVAGPFELEPDDGARASPVLIFSCLVYSLKCVALRYQLQAPSPPSYGRCADHRECMRWCWHDCIGVRFVQTEQVFPTGAARYDTVYDAYPAPVSIPRLNLCVDIQAHLASCG